MKSWSLKRRMTLVSAIVLVIAFSIIYLITKSAYTIASKTRIQESLTAQIYALMAVAEERDGQLGLPTELRNDRLNHLNSGLVAYVLDVDGDLIWRSRSSDTFGVLPNINFDYSITKISETDLDNKPMFWIGDRIIWEHENGMEGRYLFLIGEKQSILNEAVRKFKREVIVWLSITAMTIIIVFIYVLNRTLRPLQEAQSQIELISAGDAEKIQGDFPKELIPLTSSINQLLESELQQKSRYRDTLGNLAHSIKTPLAIIKSELSQLSPVAGLSAEVAANTPDSKMGSNLANTGKINSHKLNTNKTRDLLIAQVERIDDIVRYQLNRSVVTAGQTLRRKAPIKPDVEKIVDALNKVHSSKSLKITFEVDEQCFFPGDRGDLMELVGNLADNACKFAKSCVVIRVYNQGNQVVIKVEDDGSGVPEKKRTLILDRGKRLDQQAEGQGLGLSIVMDIIKTYKGELIIDQSILGGAAFSLMIPY
ncbi:ATP-binding protein [Aliikangiella maris]|uniref:ATP-binding protein n=2 Tax=Aliikangiella maris TaxID=3162458 RepID=A0ABV3MJH8_9GAMM